MTDVPAQDDGGQGPLLNDPHRLASDVNLINRAVRARWAVPEATQAAVLERLRAIVGKSTVSVACKDGVVDVEGPADANAIRAAGVLVAMTGQNQSDDHLADKNARMDQGKPTEIVDGVSIRVPGMNTAKE